MKLCIPTTSDQGLDAPVAADFSDADYLTIVETDTGEVVAQTRTGRHRRRGSGARDAAEVVRALGAEAILCRRLGRGAWAWFSDANLPVFLTDAVVARDALAEHRASHAQRMTAMDAGRFRGGAGRGRGGAGREFGGAGMGRGRHRGRHGAV
jgi:predicted Fe-Mo cluster-binding NifX family protein